MSRREPKFVGQFTAKRADGREVVILEYVGHDRRRPDVRMGDVRELYVSRGGMTRRKRAGLGFLIGAVVGAASSPATTDDAGYPGVQGYLTADAALVGGAVGALVGALSGDE